MKPFLERLLDFLSSKELLIWLTVLWVVYYLTTAVWWKEAFSHFVVGVKNNPLSQGLYLIVLINLAIRLVRTLKKDFRLVLIKAPLLIGVIIFLLSFFLSIHTRSFDYILLGEGQAASPLWENRVLYVMKITAPLREDYIDIESEKGLFRFEPKVVLSDGVRDWSVGPYPPKKIGNTYYHILDFGIAPGVRLTEGGKVIREGYMALRLLPPGSQDSFEIDPYPYRFYVKLIPERNIEKGSLVGRVYNLKRPRYNVKVFKSDKTVSEGAAAGRIEFDGLGLDFLEATYWVRMEVVRDKWLPFIAAGIILILAGIPLRLIRWLLKIKEERTFDLIS